MGWFWTSINSGGVSAIAICPLVLLMGISALSPSVFVGKPSLRKYSKRVWQPGLSSGPAGKRPVVAQIFLPTTPSGCLGQACPSSSLLKAPSSALSRAFLIILFQMGDAPETPESAPPIGVL